MPFAEETEHYARECIRLAGLTADEQARATLIEMAREWMNVAIEGKGGTPPSRHRLLLPVRPTNREASVSYQASWRSRPKRPGKLGRDFFQRSPCNSRYRLLPLEAN